jgi:hypothetical protein
MKSQPPPSKPSISQQTSVPTTHTSNSTERTEPTSSDTGARRVHEDDQPVLETIKYGGNVVWRPISVVLLLE